MSKKETKDLTSVQMLRGIASFWVVLHHSVNRDLLDESFFITNILKPFLFHGFQGVHIFFIISGFIIPYSMARYNYRISDFRYFITKRIIRIEPPYLVSMILGLTLVYITTLSPWYNGPAFTINWGNTLGHLAYLNAFTGATWINMAYWTLAVEFEFYILMALLFPYISHESRSLRFVTLVLLLCACFIPISPRHIFIHLPFFILGNILFIYHVGKISRIEMFFWMAVTLCVTLARYDISYIVVSIFTLVCIGFVKKAPVPLLFLGTISYSMYLIHGFFPPRIYSIMNRVLPNMNFWLASIVCLIIIVILSYLFYLVVEKPFYLLSKKYRPVAPKNAEQTSAPDPSTVPETHK